MTRSTFLGANVGPLYPEIGTARCSCCSILCFPAADGRCPKCVERDASVCPGCGIHVYTGEQCDCLVESEVAA